MEHETALGVLKTEGALQKKLTGKQFLALTLVTVVFPIAIIIAVGSSLS